ncbi:MAG: chemotaxis protein CheA [Acidobacteriaceae bacterium]|nr:chemotaxis protein CheA [Acidobacteriaceae bacterium]
MADQASLLSELRLHVDEVSTALLLNGPSTAVADALKQLAEAAGRTGYAKIGQIASGLAKQLPAAQSNTSTADELLRGGIAEIQTLLVAPTEGNRQSSGEESSSVAAPSQQAFSVNSLASDPELVGDFILESREHLTNVENHMLTLEKNPEEKEAVHAVFRGFHTIKGLAGFLEFMPIRDVAHDVETLLDLARNGKLTISGSVVDVVLESVDYLKQAIQVVEAAMQGDNSGEIGDNSRLLARIQKYINGDTQPEATALKATPSLAKLAESVSATPAVIHAEARSAEAPSAEASKAECVEAEAAPAAAAPVSEGPQKEQSSSKGKSDASAVIRVQTAKLDYLMDMVGEMVITQSLIRHNPAFASMQSSKLQADLSQLARITGEVQRTTMAMRMMTVGQVFQRSSRLIRDLSRRHGKQVELEITGEETEVDKTIAEELTDPLLHMVRNACDHGIETPEERIAAGKSPTARIKLAAYHQGGQIVIEIADDGRGLAREKILAKAVQKGLIEPNAHLSEQEIFNLIFEPGFSTAAQITDLSGRGVGMDVVRRNIQKLRGRIDIQSKVGQGTTFFLRLPLTLAIIEGLVVAVGVHRYIVPIYAVRELISPKPGTISTVHGRNEMAMVRDHVLPVLRLAKRFNVAAKHEDPSQGLLVVTECQEQHFCLLVDEVLGKQEVVIKSLGETLKDIPGITGGAILGDGRVGLILDLEGVFRGQKQ